MDSKTVAFMSGKQAYWMGAKRDANPNAPTKDDYGSWDDGWMTGYEEKNGKPKQGSTQDTIGTGKFDDIFGSSSSSTPATTSTRGSNVTDFKAKAPANKDSRIASPKNTVFDDGAYSSFGGERCYHKHPALKLPNSNLVIYGGSCITPAVKDADVYVGFDGGMKLTERHWPWKKGTEIRFPITDMNAPDNPEEFAKLVKYVRKQLEDGKKVHCGCIGGHGRTGTFFAALVADFGEPDAINYTRKHYCDHAVESRSQVVFLRDHYGVVEAKGYKEYDKQQSKTGSGWFSGMSTSPASGNGKRQPEKKSNIAKLNKDIVPMRGRSIWGAGL